MEKNIYTLKLTLYTMFNRMTNTKSTWDYYHYKHGHDVHNWQKIPQSSLKSKKKPKNVMLEV